MDNVKLIFAFDGRELIMKVKRDEKIVNILQSYSRKIKKES